MRRKGRFWMVIAICVGVALWTVPSRAAGPIAQQDAPGQAAPGRGGIPGATPGTPGNPVNGAVNPQPPGRVTPGHPATRGGWTLSDLLDGIVAMEQSGPRLSHAQAEKIKPALQQVVEASRLMTDTERRMKQILTPEQLAYIRRAQREGKLFLDTASLSAKPGEDPVVARVIDILEKKVH